MTPVLSWQSSLFAADAPRCDDRFARLRRTWLDDSTWVDHLPAWMAGSDELFADLADTLPWRQRHVTMWDRRVPEPRLTAWWDAGSGTPIPHSVLQTAQDSLTRYYERPFDSIGFNLYRDGRDSVAWHSDRERFSMEQPIVVIVSLGAPRVFLLRPRGGGASARFELGHGDLFVMGGSCQHDWEHAVPKSARASGPRLSVMFRHHLAGLDPDRSGWVEAAAPARTT